MKTTVIYHSADYDGIFCREIAKKFLPGAEFIGWNFGDKTIELEHGRDGQIIVLDLPLDEPLGLRFLPESSGAKFNSEGLIWIDHHKSSIDSHPKNIPGYRIDGVAACRLAWQWFAEYEMHNPDAESHCMIPGSHLPNKQNFINRAVNEPLSVRLAGEYDIWDKRDPDAELFQHGLRSQNLETMWPRLLGTDVLDAKIAVNTLLKGGEVLQYAKTKENESIIKNAGFTIEFEGLKMLACNHARYNSHLFMAGLKPEHEACFGFCWKDGAWTVNLYHAPGKEHHDLSIIAVKHGGGGHRGACGFRTKSLPFI